MTRRLGATEASILASQSNLASTYSLLGREEEALCMRRNIYSEWLRLEGEEYIETLGAAYSYAGSLSDMQCFEDVKSLLRKTVPVTRRVLGDSHEVTLKMRSTYAQSLCHVDGATLDDRREAVTTLEDLERIAQRVMGGAHPTTAVIGRTLQKARAALRAREAA